ncbi:MAG: hypothetical protein ACFBZ8_12125 [Opitutales bacterium]
MFSFRRKPSGNGLLWLVDENSTQRAMFQESFDSAQRWMPNVAKAVLYIGRHPKVAAECFRLRSKAQAHAAKFDAWAQSPFEQTLFLDNDTFVRAPLTHYFEHDTDVVAVPYPNFFEKAELQVPWGSEVPTRWQNVNSGVVLFHKSFVSRYREIWKRYGTFAPRLPGKDQCLFSLALTLPGVRWQPDLHLQISTTDFAVEFIRSIVGAPREPALEGVPMSLIQAAYVFHTTAEKQRHRDAYRQCNQAQDFLPAPSECSLNSSQIRLLAERHPVQFP